MKEKRAVLPLWGKLLLGFLLVVLALCITAVTFLNVQQASADNKGVLPELMNYKYCPVESRALEPAYAPGALLLIRRAELYEPGERLIIVGHAEEFPDQVLRGGYLLVDMGVSHGREASGTALGSGETVSFTQYEIVGKVVRAVPGLGTLYSLSLGIRGVLLFIVIPMALNVLLVILLFGIAAKRRAAHEKEAAAGAEMIPGCIALTRAERIPGTTPPPPGRGTKDDPYAAVFDLGQSGKPSAAKKASALQPSAAAPSSQKPGTPSAGTAPPEASKKARWEKLRRGKAQPADKSLLKTVDQLDLFETPEAKAEPCAEDAGKPAFRPDGSQANTVPLEHFSLPNAPSDPIAPKEPGGIAPASSGAEKFPGVRELPVTGREAADPVLIPPETPVLPIPLQRVPAFQPEPQDYEYDSLADTIEFDPIQSRSLRAAKAGKAQAVRGTKPEEPAGETAGPAEPLNTAASSEASSKGQGAEKPVSPAESGDMAQLAFALPLSMRDEAVAIYNSGSGGTDKIEFAPPYIRKPTGDSLEELKSSLREQKSRRALDIVVDSQLNSLGEEEKRQIEKMNAFDPDRAIEEIKRKNALYEKALLLGKAPLLDEELPTGFETALEGSPAPTGQKADAVPEDGSKGEISPENAEAGGASGSPEESRIRQRRKHPAMRRWTGVYHPGLSFYEQYAKEPERPMLSADEIIRLHRQDYADRRFRPSFITVVGEEDGFRYKGETGRCYHNRNDNDELE